MGVRYWGSLYLLELALKLTNMVNAGLDSGSSSHCLQPESRGEFAIYWGELGLWVSIGHDLVWVWACLATMLLRKRKKEERRGKGRKSEKY